MISDIIYNQADTICAVSTAPGAGGIAVIRVSGPDTLAIADSIWQGKSLAQAKTHTAHLGNIIGADGAPLDQCVATIFRSPNSFTGEDIVEFSVHGSRWIQSQLLDLLTQKGARIAAPGEFTQRAFANGKLDLAQAEAVADLIASSSQASHRLAFNQMRGNVSSRLTEMREELLQLACLLELELDFSEEDVEFASRTRLLELAEECASHCETLAATFRSGSAIKNGIPVALIGATNAGKSSLLNTLLGDDRAIVSDIHGTTRDIVEDIITIGQYQIRFQDTAGLRQTVDPIEAIGIERSRKAAATADLTIYLIDATNPAKLEEFDPSKTIIAVNKSDLTDTHELAESLRSQFQTTPIVEISAAKSKGIDTLRNAITRYLEQTHGKIGQDTLIITNARHATALSDAATSLRALAEALTNDIPVDLAAQDLREALHHLSSITGAITTPEILQSIFQSFCIGK